MKGFKGFTKDLTCKDKQYEIGGTYNEPTADLCTSGLHFCEAPSHPFAFYAPGTSRFCETEAEDISEQTDKEISKRVCKKLTIGAELTIPDICKVAVNGFFEWFKFEKKIAEAKQSTENNAGNYGAANAGYKGAANAGYCGAANAGDCGAANAGNYGAANAGYKGAANAGDCGAAVVQASGTAAVGKSGVAVCMGNESKAKGALNAVLVLVQKDDDGEIIGAICKIVDGETVKADTWYTLKNGEFTKAE